MIAPLHQIKCKYFTCLFITSHLEMLGSVDESKIKLCGCERCLATLYVHVSKVVPSQMRNEFCWFKTVEIIPVKIFKNYYFTLSTKSNILYGFLSVKLPKCICGLTGVLTGGPCSFDQIKRKDILNVLYWDCMFHSRGHYNEVLFKTISSTTEETFH